MAVGLTRVRPGSSGVVWLTRVRPGGRCVNPGKLALLGFALGVVRLLQSCWVN